ncbi:MAG: helix-turn-helix domain-containing protein [Campylobacterales bacterium]|nr:helix-turn-helix domain-containing protein [Campylobacterales bacterium]
MNQSLSIIREAYPGKVILTKKEVASLLRMSSSTIDRAIAENDLDKIPKFKRFGKGSRARLLFPVNSIVEYLEEQNK